MKKVLLSIFSVVMALSMMTVNVSAYENDAVSETQLMTNISANLMKKADKYIMLENKQYVYVDNPELSLEEKNQVINMIKEANAIIASAQEGENTLVSKEDDYVSITDGNPMTSTFGYGYNGVHVHWWGLRIFLNKDVTQWACEGVSVSIAAVIGAVTGGAGWAIAGAVGGHLMEGVCQWSIHSGTIIDYNFFWGDAQMIGWQ